MIIHEAEPYTNRDGITEKPYQYFYFQEYKQLPPPVRTIPNLYQILQKKQENNQLPFQLYKIDTIYKYRTRFDWDERILKDSSTRNQQTQIINSDYLYNGLWEDIMDYHQKTRKQKKKLTDWDNTDTTNTAQVRSLNDIQKTYDQSLRTLLGSPMDLAEMYAMMEVLSQAVQGDEDRMSVLESLLDTEEPEEEDDEE